VPAPPYYSVQLGTATGRAQALARLQAFKDAPYARAERRRSGWQIRAGAWPDRAAADAAAAQFRAGGAKDARVLSMENPVAWLLPDGTTVQPRSAVTAAAPATAAAAPAPAAAPSTAGPRFIPAPPVPPAKPVATELEVTPEFRTAAQKVDAEMRRWLRVEGPVRRDGFLYGMDLAPLLLYAAQRGDQTLYLQLLPAARKLIVDDPKDPYTRGFVLWRRKDGVALDVSGATEALWMARALWAGAGAFNRAEDRALALTIVEGYTRHAADLQGFWLVRKYFAFAGRGFAGLSTVSNYHGDFLSEIEQQVPRADWNGFAERSWAMVERARTRSGLLKPLIQPEVAATYPDLDVALYAPNGHASLHDSCAAAEGAARGRPQVADAVLAFARDDDHAVRTGRLFAYFRADDGEPVGIAELSSTGYACLGRLAAARDDRRTFRTLVPFLQLSMRNIADVPSAQIAPLYDGGQLLLAAYAAGAFNP
jgi:hypothetical protein